MENSGLLLRKGIVLCSALLYWAGVLVLAARVRKHIGHSPNVRPRGIKERLLWAGWFLVVLGWIGQPFMVGGGKGAGVFGLNDLLLHPLALVLGTALVLAGHAGTFWCYAAIGDAWRIGIDRKERTALVREGPYRSIRHPIYLFQIVILAGAGLLLPTPFSVLLMVIQLICVLVKALDEEAFLSDIHGDDYLQYRKGTGMLLPRMRRPYHRT